MRRLLHGVAAVVVTIAVAVAFTTVRVPRPAGTSVATMELSAGARVTLDLPGATGDHTIELTFGNRRAGVVLHAENLPVTVVLPPLPTTGVLDVRVRPATPVELHPGGGGAVRLVRWGVATLPTELPTPVALPDGVSAAIDESDVFGVRPFGVPLRAQPTVAGEELATVYHGDVLVAECWAAGEEITNGFPTHPRLAYTSNVWFGVETWTGQRAFVPDTRFTRTGNGDRLGLPPC
jgi:hypothetical protein